MIKRTDIYIQLRIKREDKNYNMVQAFPSSNRYNLLVSSMRDAWENESYQLERDRCLTSFTPQNIKEEYDSFNREQIDIIKSYPCIFAYEDGLKEKFAYIGYITDLVIRNSGIKFYIQKHWILSHDVLHKYAFELDISLSGGITKLMHTHWTIKDVDLREEIQKRSISILPYKGIGLEEITMPSNSIDLLKPMKKSGGGTSMLEKNPELKYTKQAIAFSERIGMHAFYRFINCSINCFHFLKVSMQLKNW